MKKEDKTQLDLRIIIKPLNGMFAILSLALLLMPENETGIPSDASYLLIPVFILFFCTYRFMRWKAFNEEEYIAKLGDTEESNNGE